MPFPKQVNSTDGGEIITPASLPLDFDHDIFLYAFKSLQEILEEQGGFSPFLEAMANKHRLFAEALGPKALEKLDAETLRLLVETMFTVRRRLWPSVQTLGPEAFAERANELLYGGAPLAKRIDAFVASFELEDEKAQRSVVDLAAELLHFSDPDTYPLMTRWVWDQKTQSGALREFVRGNDHMPEVFLGDSPEMFEGARHWLGKEFEGEGFYRDIPFMINLLLAHQYNQYMKSMAEGFLRSDFGGGDPAETIKKLIGIDSRRKEGASRLKEDTIH